MFAPVARLGLVVIWDDGDDLHAEPRAPYPHVREVLALRAHQGRARRAAGRVRPDRRGDPAGGQRLGHRARPRTGPRSGGGHRGSRRPATTRSWPGTRPPARPGCPAWPCAPRARRSAAGRCCSRCPGAATSSPSPASAAASGPAAQRAAARCPCPGRRRAPCAAGAAGPRARSACGCGQPGLRALVVGAGRTAEELGRAFPAAKVLTSGRNGVIAEVGSAPAVVVATPGAEPRADGGYAAAVLLDGWALLGRASLRAAEEALRRWLNAAALVRPGGRGRHPWSWWPTPRCRWCRPWSAGIRSPTPSVSWPSASSSGSRRRSGWPR